MSVIRFSLQINFDLNSDYDLLQNLIFEHNYLSMNSFENKLRSSLVVAGVSVRH